MKKTELVEIKKAIKDKSYAVVKEKAERLILWHLNHIGALKKEVAKYEESMKNLEEALLAGDYEVMDDHSVSRNDQSTLITTRRSPALVLEAYRG